MGYMNCFYYDGTYSIAKFYVFVKMIFEHVTAVIYIYWRRG